MIKETRKTKAEAEREEAFEGLMKILDGFDPAEIMDGKSAFLATIDLLGDGNCKTLEQLKALSILRFVIEGRNTALDSLGEAVEALDSAERNGKADDGRFCGTIIDELDLEVKLLKGQVADLKEMLKSSEELRVSEAAIYEDELDELSESYQKVCEGLATTLAEKFELEVALAKKFKKKHIKMGKPNSEGYSTFTYVSHDGVKVKAKARALGDDGGDGVKVDSSVAEDARCSSAARWGGWKLQHLRNRVESLGEEDANS